MPTPHRGGLFFGSDVVVYVSAERDNSTLRIRPQHSQLDKALLSKRTKTGEPNRIDPR